MQAQGIAALAPGQAAPMQNPAMQKQTPMGPNPGIPPDLKQLLAQQARNEMAQAAQRYQALQQALQMGQGQGKPPTVAQQVEMQGQKERAATAGPALQVQEQQKQAGLQALAEGQRGTPENPPQPQGQGIAELEVPEFGMAGGGIIAFEDGGGVMGDLPGYVPGGYGEHKTEKEQEAYENWWEKVGQFLAPINEFLTRDTRPGVRPEAAAAEPGAVPPEAAQMTTNPAARLMHQGAMPAPIPTTPSSPPAPAGIAAALKAQQATPQRPPMAVPQTAAPTDDFTKQAQNLALASATQDPMAQAKALSDEYSKTQGIGDLVKQQQDMLADQRARYAQANANRLPAWVVGGMGATQPRGAGIGSLLASWGSGAAKAREGYAKEDLAQGDKLDVLRGAIIKAQMDGNQKKADALTSAYEKEVQAKASGLGSTASLAGTLENAKARVQAAKDAAAARIQVAEEGRLNRASGQEERTYATQSNAAMARATALVEKEEALAAQTLKPNPIAADERIMQYYTKFLRQSLPPTLQHLAPNEYKPSAFTTAPTGTVRTLQVPGKS